MPYRSTASSGREAVESVTTATGLARGYRPGGARGGGGGGHRDWRGLRGGGNPPPAAAVPRRSAGGRRVVRLQGRPLLATRRSGCRALCMGRVGCCDVVPQQPPAGALAGELA